MAGTIDDSFEAMAVAGDAEEMLENVGRPSKADRTLAREIARLCSQLSKVETKVDKWGAKIIGLEADAGRIRRSISQLEREVDSMQDGAAQAASIAATVANQTAKASAASSRRTSERLGGMAGNVVISTIRFLTR